MPTPDLRVAFTPAAESQLEALAPALRLLASKQAARTAIEEVLIADPRSVHWRQNRAGLDYGFSIDTLNVVCHFEGDGVSVTQVQHIDLCDRSHVAGEAAVPLPQSAPTEAAPA